MATGCTEQASSLTLRPAISADKTLRAVFVGLQGTLIDAACCSANLENFRFAPGALGALRLLHGAGFHIVVVSHQPGIALRTVGLDSLRRQRRALARRMARGGVPLTGFYVCPHSDDTTTGPQCSCCFPKPGLVQLAAQTHGIDLAYSWVVGERWVDVQAGHSAGCRTALVGSQRKPIRYREPVREPTVSVANLYQASEFIVAQGAPATKS